MKKLLAVFSLVLATAGVAAPPYVGYVYPSSLQRGTTNRVIVGGQYLWGGLKFHLSGDGVKILEVENVPGFSPPASMQRRYLYKWLDAIAEGKRERPPLPNDPRLNEWRSNTWWKVLGELDAQKLSIVEHYLYVPQNALQMTPSLRQRVLVTIAVDKNAKVGTRKLLASAINGMSPPRPVLITDEPQLEERLYVPPKRRDMSPLPVKGLPIVLNGQIMPGETDRFELSLVAGEKICMQVVGREFQPYIGDAVPGFFNPVLKVIDQNGKECAFADDFGFHPDPVLEFTPKTTGKYVLEIRDNLFRGRADFVYSIAVTKGTQNKPYDKLSIWKSPVSEIKEGRLFKGAVPRDGMKARHRINISSLGKYVFDLRARRIASRLDAQMVLRDRDGNVLKVFDDIEEQLHVGALIQGECDPYGTYEFKKQGTYELEISDATGFGGEKYFYELLVNKESEGVEIWTSASGIAGRLWASANIEFNVIRKGGFNGKVKLIPPKDLRFSPLEIPAGTNSLPVKVSLAPGNDLNVFKKVDIKAEVELNGKKTIIPVNVGDKYNQAFAWDHILPAEAFMIYRYRSNRPPPSKKNKDKKRK
jgi:hypothetical protein